MSIIINGYRTNENISNNTFESIMKKIRMAVDEKQRAGYIHLLSEEVNMVVDFYVLNYISINNGKSILDVAQERLAQKIDEASRNNQETRYNYHIAMEIMSHKKRWYFLIASNNDTLSDGLLDSVKELEKFITTDDEDERTEEAAKVWGEIREKYTSTLQPMRMHFMIPLPLNINPADIQFQSIKDRAFYQAENKEYSLIYQSLTNGRPIPPMEIMRFMDEITLERQNPIHAINVQRNMSQLLVMLPNITTELITKPCEMIFQTETPPEKEETHAEETKAEN